jgi:hypothetical protein
MLTEDVACCLDCWHAGEGAAKHCGSCPCCSGK